MNNNKIVQISSNSSNITKDNSWHYNISNILSNRIQQGALDKISAVINNDTFSSFLSNSNRELLYVTSGSNFSGEINSKPNIVLLYEKPLDVTSFGTKNEYETPIKDLLGTGKTDSELLLDAFKAATGDVKAAAGVLFNKGQGLYNAISPSNKIFNPWFVNIPSMKDIDATKPFDFKYEFNFRMGQYGLWNAKEEVVKPILNLIAPTLPREISAFTVDTPYPTAFKLLNQTITDAISKMFSGISESLGGGFSGVFNKLQENIKKEYHWDETKTGVDGFIENVATVLEEIITGAYHNYTYTVSFGNSLIFPNCLIKDSSFNFSNETDQFGYPISGSVTLTFSVLNKPALTYSGTKNKISARFGGLQ